MASVKHSHQVTVYPQRDEFDVSKDRWNDGHTVAGYAELAGADFTGTVTIGDGGTTDYIRFDGSDGELTLHGTAMVMKTADIDLNLLRATGIAPDPNQEDGFFTLDFAQNLDEGTKVEWHIPHDYTSAGAIHFHLHFFVDNVPVGVDETVEWTLEYKKLSDGDVYSFAGAASDTQTQVVATTDTNKEIYELTEIDLTTTGFASGDHLLIYLHRDGGNGSDDFGGDARLHSLHLEYLSDRLGE